jgi:hypothetical protein
MRTFVLAWTVEPEVASEKDALDMLLAGLAAKGIGHVYCMNPTLQWTVTFSSGEEVLARWFPPDDRHPPIPQAVDRALFEGRPVAIVGYLDQLEEFRRAERRLDKRPLAPIEVAGRYFMVERPYPELLDALGFQLNSVAPPGPG